MAFALGPQSQRGGLPARRLRPDRLDQRRSDGAGARRRARPDVVRDHGADGRARPAAAALDRAARQSRQQHSRSASTSRPRVAATLGFAAGLGAGSGAAAGERRGRAAASARIGYDMTIALKWPNDVLAGRAEARRHPAGGRGHGRRPAGRRGRHRHQRRRRARGHAVRRRPRWRALGVHVGAEELFAALSDAWVEFRGIWDNGRGFAEIRKLWLERAAGLGEPVSIQSGATDDRRHIRHHR